MSPGKDPVPIELATDRDLWGRQPGETVNRFNQFCAYRDLGRARTINRAAEALKRSRGYMRMVSAAYHWVARAEAFDRHRDDLYEKMWLEERREAAANDAKLLNAVIGKIDGRLNTLNPEELSVGDLTRLLDVAMRHRRALFGDPATTVAVTGPGGDPLTVQLAEFAQLPAEQRRAEIAQLAASVLRATEALSDLDDDDD